ncbi:zinc-dependent alcohol dehydrogenase [Paenibacillus agricola]|uniref:Zinc-binding alcohol dehydrogenase n=1 Tax=Paenibacillus agricola TaxID=2716264 RepID=A0ABX0JIZ8_9BACL|nr:zinc-binding alcohol dehydrogenase [Paenibacillus agricola]NHN35374.1 zinc-binding alcohol dehydrogenase [Paenibacillus agricola]
MGSTTMIGLAVTELGKKAELIELLRPQVDDDSIVIQTAYSCVSIGTEMWIATGRRKDYGDPPFINGYQATGTVVELGANVDHVVEGDLVAVFCSGAHGQFVKAKKHLVYKLNNESSLQTASMFVQPSVAANAYNLASIETGHLVYIVGQGFIGQCAAKLARLKGAYVISSDISPTRLKLSAKHCADWAIDASERPASQQILERFPEGADVVAESSGFTQLVDDAMTSCRKRGQFIFMGWYPDNITYNFNIPHQKQLSAFYPCFIGPRSVQESVIRMIENGSLPLQEHISHLVHWQDSAATYNTLFTPERNQYNVILFDWHSPH